MPVLTVGTASRADGLTAWWVERPNAAATTFAWVCPAAGRQFPHRPGIPEIAAAAQITRLRRGPQPSSVGGAAGLSALYLLLKVPPEVGGQAVAHFVRVVSAPPNGQTVEDAKQIVESRLRREAFGASRVSRRLVHAGMFGEEHPLGLGPKPLAEHMRQVVARDVRAFWSSRASPGGSALIVVGRAAEALARRVLAAVPTTAAVEPAAEAWAPREDTRDEPRIRIVRAPTRPWIEVVYPILGNGVARAKEAHLAAQVLGGALIGRLGEALRLSSGHSYALQATYRPYARFAELRVSGNVGEGDVPFFIERTQEVIAALADAPVEEEELRRARARWLGSVIRQLSTSFDTARWLVRAFAQDRAVPDLEAEAAALERITAGHLQGWTQEALVSERAEVVVFARAQAVLPLTLVGDAAQVSLEPF